MKFSIENRFFNPGPSLCRKKQGPGLKFSSENEHFKPRMKISSENGFLCVGEWFFSCVRARRIFCDLWALRVAFHRKIPRGSDKISGNFWGKSWGPEIEHKLVFSQTFRATPGYPGQQGYRDDSIAISRNKDVGPLLQGFFLSLPNPPPKSLENKGKHKKKEISRRERRKKQKKKPGKEEQGKFSTETTFAMAIAKRYDEVSDVLPFLGQRVLWV